MLISTLIIFIIAAILGGYLLTFILKEKRAPRKVAMIHGFVAAIGILLLVIYSIYGAHAPILSLVIFILTAIGGLSMMYLRSTKKNIPGWMAFGHGMVAIIGLATLIIFILV
jgi:FtsH-binding integral membrane protein